jgi:hypothetical protein
VNLFNEYQGPKEYESLANVLHDAFDQAASGKGKERHANGDEQFEDQICCSVSKRIGVAGPLFQVIKKADEASRMKPEAAVRELYGAINYAAAAIIVLEDKMTEKKLRNLQVNVVR